MANKNIIVSNNGKYEPISASVDSNSGQLSASLPLTVNTASFVAQSGIMEIYNGKLMPIANTSISNPQSNYSGSLLSYDTSEGFGPQRAANASFSGDISGDTVNGIKVRSVGNVTNGVLPLTYGGTGTGSFSVNSLITTSGSGLSPSDPNKIVVAGSNSYISGIMSLLNFFNSNAVISYLYTGSVGVSNTATWSKPSGCRFVTVICQAGGSAGWSANGGWGGGGGGLSYATFNGLSLPNTVSIQAGQGGLPQGGAGGNSFFGNYIIAYGGSQTNGGIGYTENGAAGGAGSTTTSQNGRPGGSSIYAGAGGGGAGQGAGGNASGGGAGGSVTGRPGVVGTGPVGNRTDGPNTVEVKLNIFNTFKVLLNGTTLIDLPPLLSGGGSGAGGITSTSTLLGKGGNAQWGSGGGGSCNRTAGTGGKGYVLIICS